MKNVMYIFLESRRMGYLLFQNLMIILSISKNLRVCGGCHTVTKFISKMRNREAIVRDASRYHHSKDEECSRDDYW